MANPEIEFLKSVGYEVKALTAYQFRVNRTLDLGPKRRKFHNIETQQRGVYPLDRKALKEFIEGQLKTTKLPLFESARKHAEDKPLAPGRYFREWMAPSWARKKA
jgi:hypothetical protein